MKDVLPEGMFDQTPPSLNPEGSEIPGEPPAEDLLANSQSVSLFIQDSGKYVNIDYYGWAVIGDTAVTKYLMVTYYDYNYIVVANGDYKGSYLSYNDRSYIGAYSGWSSARYWNIDPVDCSPYPGLYPYNGYLCVDGVRKAIDKIVTVVAY
jgi:hypothetical protein